MGRPSSRSRRTARSSRARSSRSSRAASSSTSGCAASCPPRSSSCAGCATCSRTSARSSRPRSSSSTSNRNNVVLSRRAWLEETQKEQRGDFLRQPEARASVRKGVVSSVVNFGAFVDLGGMDGLVHVSELSWKHVDHPSSVVQVGDEVDGRGARRRPRQGADLAVAEGHPVRPVAGVRRHATTSASSSTAGSPSWCPSAPSSRSATASRAWCTSRRWPAHHVDLPEQVVTAGEELWVKIIDIDLQRRRISLSIKQAAEGGEVVRGVPRGLRRARLRRRGQLHRGFDYADGEFTPETEAQAAWAEEFAADVGSEDASDEDSGAEPAAEPEAVPAVEPETPAVDQVVDAPAEAEADES